MRRGAMGQGHDKCCLMRRDVESCFTEDRVRSARTAFLKKGGQVIERKEERFFASFVTGEKGVRRWELGGR